MARTPIPSYTYVLVVCEYEGRYLLVEERKHGGGFYLPAGGVELGETIVEAAVRETLEEAAVLVEPTAILALDHEWLPGEGQVRQKWRYVLTAQVVNDPTPKRTADKHSLGARWVAPQEIHDLALRHHEVCDWVQLALAGGPTLPIHRYRGVGLHRREVDFD
ncbi:MAG: NUDIX hydrolase [Deltaproteobacteria bacterium]|nr:MAG: NUDIX hydrolase [Deltaproteobacteria bacterium]